MSQLHHSNNKDDTAIVLSATAMPITVMDVHVRTLSYNYEILLHVQNSLDISYYSFSELSVSDLQCKL